MLFGKRRDEGRFLIIGLGNPGKKYRNTRHNVGFMALDYLSEVYGIRVTRSRFSSLAGEGKIGEVKVVLVKPMTFMNLSGQAVAAVSSYYKVPPERIIVICDDINLSPGVIRIRDHGSSGGQRGLLSIEDMLESKDYIRVRIGVGDRASGELSSHVLSSPDAADNKAITERFPDIAQAVELILTNRLTEAQSLYNGSI